MAEKSNKPNSFVLSMMLAVMLLTLPRIQAACSADQLPGNFKNDQAIADVLSGKDKVANAAWWGFDKDDSTAAIQNAINSGASRVIIPYTGSDWIVCPIHLVSNQEIVFEPGVVIAAKKGQFKGDHDSLFMAAGNENITLQGYGATWRMNKEDYTDPNNYKKAEWRMGFMCLSSRNIKVLGLTIKDTGGDGIYFGQGGEPAYNSNIVVKDCVFDNNYRQGISIIGAVDLLIENCIFKNTSGTGPADGIDFEPNNEQNKMVNCTVRNCVFENNQGDGIQVSVSRLTEKTENISVLIENCYVKSSGKFGFIVGTVRKVGVKGLIEFRNCTVENTQGPGFIIWDTPAGSVNIRFTNCKWKNVNLTGEHPDIHVPISDISGEVRKPVSEGATDFINCYLYGRKDRPFLVPEELEKSHGIWHMGGI